MARVIVRTLIVALLCVMASGSAFAQERKGKRGGGDHPSPEARFDAMEKLAKHDPLTGTLTKDEFIKAVKESGSRMADHAEEFFNRIKKADENKVTKDEFVTAAKEMRAKYANRKPDQKPERKPEQ